MGYLEPVRTPLLRACEDSFAEIVNILPIELSVKQLNAMAHGQVPGLSFREPARAL